jgi:hypothetical protein
MKMPTCKAGITSSRQSADFNSTKIYQVGPTYQKNAIALSSLILKSSNQVQRKGGIENTTLEVSFLELK